MPKRFESLIEWSGPIRTV